MTISIHVATNASTRPATRFDQFVETMRRNLVLKKARSNRPLSLSKALRLAIGMIAIALTTTFPPGSLASQSDLPLTPPNPPAITALVPSANSLNVYWNPPPIDANNAPTHYIIDWHPGYQTQPITYPDPHNARAFANLTPGTTYSFRVIAVNDAGKSFSAPVTGIPLPGPIVAFAQVDETSITQTTADVNVTLLNPDAQNLDVYLRYRAISDTQSPPWIVAPATATTGTSAAFSLSGLTPASLYEIQASLVQSFLGDVAEDTLITPGPPVKPILSLVPGDGTLTAHWSTFLNGGTPTNYLLEWKPSSEPNFTNSANPPVSDSTFVISDLTNGRTYDARITVTTDLGSATSDVVSVEPALKPVVSMIEIVELNGVDLTEKYTSINLHAAMDPPTLLVRILPRYGNMLGPYRYGVRSGQPTDTLISTTRLEADREYVFQAVLIQGDETPNWDLSAQMNLRTEPGVPWAGNRPTIVHGDREFTVYWQKTRYDGGSPITGYVVWWRSDTQLFSSQRTVVFGPNARTATVAGLQNGIRYTVAVQPRNAHGGPISNRTIKTTPSTAPRIAPTIRYAAPCATQIVIGWTATTLTSGGLPFTDFTLQWRGIDQQFSPTDRQVNVGGLFSNTTAAPLELNTEYAFRIRAHNVNGPAYRLVTDPVEGTMTTVPLWSEEFRASTRDAICFSGPRFGNILADSIPVTFGFFTLDNPADIFLRHRELGTARWHPTQHSVAQPARTSINFDLTGLKPDTLYEIQASPLRSFPINDSWIFRAQTLPAPTTGFTPGARARILRIEPTISSVNLSPGDSIDLAANIYGRQNILDNTLADLSPEDGGPVFDWQSSPTISFAETDVSPGRRNNTPDDRKVRVTAPETPGTYTITVGFTNPNMCLGARQDETEQEQQARCSATFQLTVRRSSVVDLFELPPVNPSGSIPKTLTDPQGTAYAVFTPLDGGVFFGEGIELSAGPGAVASNEIIGISVTRAGEASNAGQIHHRYTLAGSRYEVRVTNSNGEPAEHYVLNKAATICLPLPDELRRRIDKIVIVATNGVDSQTLLSTKIRITPGGVLACGEISKLPADVAVGALERPQPLPTPSPEVPTDILPKTGGSTVAPFALVMVFMFGASLVAWSVGSVLSAVQRNRQRR